MPNLRVLSVNARTLPHDRDQLAALIESHRPDVACVHGSPSLLRWRSISAALARKAGLVVVGGGRTGGGNLVLSTLGVDVLGTRDLAFAGQRGVRPPGATLAVLRLRGSDFVVAAARLLGQPSDRLRQARELEAAIAGVVPGTPPAVISVEGVDGPGGPAALLAENRIAAGGGVFVDTRIAVEVASVVDGPSSSGPVLLELALLDPAT